MAPALEAVTAQIRERAAVYCEEAKVPGYLAGVYHDGGQAVVAHGTANLVTGAAMREDTGFLFGSVTKVATTTLVLGQAEQGAVGLDERVVKYLPEFKLATPTAAGGAPPGQPAARGSAKRGDVMRRRGGSGAG